MGEYYLPVENCQLGIDGNVPRVESAPVRHAKSLYRKIIPENFRRLTYRMRRGINVEYPTQITQGCDGVKAIFEVNGLKEHLRVKDISCESKYLKEGLELIKPGDIFWEIGAYAGVWSLLAAKKNPTVQVYSFEPEPECFQALKHNLNLNRLNGQVAAMKMAISDGTLLTDLRSSGREGQCASLRAASGYLHQYEIHTFSVADVIRMGWAPKPTIMKIDVEGAEDLVIKGISEQNRPEHLFVELHPDFLIRNYQTTPVAVWNNILSLGFEPVHVWQRSSDVLGHFKLK